MSERSTTAKRVRVHGNVQGVFFRDATQRAAREAGVAGWVSNRDGGGVEAFFEGTADAVQRMVDFCREGPSAADVESVDVQDAEPEGLGGFEVR